MRLNSPQLQLSVGRAHAFYSSQMVGGFNCKWGLPLPQVQSVRMGSVFLTPTRMRLKGRVIENPTLAQLVSSLSLRLSMLAETFTDAPLSYDYKAMIERAHQVTTQDSTLRLMALDRYSNRRGGKLELDGFMGDVTFAGPAIKELLPLLVAGEVLNVGSGTAFGLGRYLIIANGMMPRSKAD